jgi:hypothetical protein
VKRCVLLSFLSFLSDDVPWYSGTSSHHSSSDVYLERHGAWDCPAPARAAAARLWRCCQSGPESIMNKPQVLRTKDRLASAVPHRRPGPPQHHRMVGACFVEARQSVRAHWPWRTRAVSTGRGQAGVPFWTHTCARTHKNADLAYAY